MNLMNSIKISILFFILISTFCGFSQETPVVVDSLKQESVFTYFSNSENSKAQTQINQSPEIEAMVNKHIAIGEKNKCFHGYRIRIFSDLGYDARKNANNMKSNFMKLFPDVASYVVYDDPNFKVVVGNFREKSEAVKFLMTMKEAFPSAFIVKDLIEPTF
jgi:hypothetical protein